MAKYQSQHLTLSGPFFEKDPRKTFRQNVRLMMEKLAAEAQADVQAEMGSRSGSMPNWTGWSQEHVKGRVVSVGGKAWAVSLVVSEGTQGMTRSEAVRTLAAGSSVEGRFHVFRHAATRLRSMRALLNADLTKGLE